MSSGTTSADGFSILLSFDQDLFSSLSASEFAVTAGGSKLVDSAVISGASEITLHLNEGIKNDEEISVVYTGSGIPRP